MYRTKESAEDVMRVYDEALVVDGWFIVHGPADEPNARAYFRGGKDVIVFAEPRDGRTMVSVVDMISR